MRIIETCVGPSQDTSCVSSLRQKFNEPSSAPVKWGFSHLTLFFPSNRQVNSLCPHGKVAFGLLWVVFRLGLCSAPLQDAPQENSPRRVVSVLALGGLKRGCWGSVAFVFEFAVTRETRAGSLTPIFCYSCVVSLRTRERASTAGQQPRFHPPAQSPNS